MIGDDETRNEFMALASAGVIERAGMGDTVETAVAVPGATSALEDDIIDTALPAGDATPVVTTLFNETIVDEGPIDALLEFDDAPDNDDLLTEADFELFAQLGPVDVAAQTAVRENVVTTAVQQPVFQTLGTPQAIPTDDVAAAAEEAAAAATTDAEDTTDEGPTTALTETDDAATDDAGEGLPTEGTADPAAQAGQSPAAIDAAECPDAMGGQDDAGTTETQTAATTDQATTTPTTAATAATNGNGTVQPLNQDIVTAANAGDAEAAADAAAAANAAAEGALPTAAPATDAPVTGAPAETTTAEAAPVSPAQAIADAAADAMAAAIGDMPTGDTTDCPMEEAMAMMQLTDDAAQTITVDADAEADA